MNTPIPLHASNQPRQAILFFLLLMLGNLTAQAQNNWTGNANNRDWNTASNWSAGIPTATSDVVIPSAPANQPVLSTTATAKSVEVQAGASLSISNSGSLTLNGSKPIPNDVLNFTCTFLNDGSVNNSGQVVIGSSATASVGELGIRNTGTFANNTGGNIAIDRTTSTGLFNVNGSFSNSATITIGAVASVGEQGILNQATFANNTGGSITIDQISLTGLINNRSFTNSAQITIRAGRTGILNGATNSTFQNTGCAALINIVADAYILNIGTFSNGGTIIENATGNSSISSNAGLVQNLNGGTFTITGTNTGLITTISGSLPVITATPSLTITQGQSTTLTASGALSYSWSTGETTPAITVSATGPYSVTGTTGGCSSKATVSMTVVPTFTVSNPAICPGQFVNLGNYVSNKSPITGDLTYYTSQANAQAGTNALISGLVGPVNVPVTYYVRYDAAGSFSIQPIMVTLKPALPAPPVLTQNGHAYMGGVASVTVAQNSESVILAVPGCDGTVSWSGPNNFISFNSTISVPTATTGSFTYQASCSSQTACYSGSSQATITVNVVVPPCGTVVYVTPGGAGSQNGSSWGNAFAGTALQTAINTAAGCGAQVWVAAGLYKPTTMTGPNSRTISFSMANGVAIYGGFAGNEAANYDLSLRNLVTNQTTLSGDIDGSGTLANNSYHVILNPRGLTTSAILDGFLITGGNANGNPDIRGGGVLNQGGNTNNACSPTFRNCLFRANSAVLGGAMYNQAGGSGTSSPVLVNCSFQGNSASQWGGAMLNDGFDKGTSSPVLVNCSFQGNSASANGGGALYNEGEGNGISLPMLTNCVVFGNGGANTFFNNRGTTGVSATYSLFDDAVTGYNTGGTGNLTTAVSPFVSASSVALIACSAAINVGDPSTTTATVGATDLAGNNRIVGGRVDMGAVEYQGNPFSVSITANPSLTITQGQSITLTALGADSYRWSSGETTAAISVSVARPYSVTGTTTAGCSSVASVTLTVNAPGCGAGLSGPIWTGCVSTDWNTAGNWASGTVPTATDDVVIPSAPANQPILSTNAVAKSVEVQSGASLSISSAGSLTITDSRRFQTFTASFWNKGRVVSGGQLIINNPTVSVYGLVNSGNFDNVPGGQIRIDGANSIGLYTIGGSFVNSSTITIGNASQYGVFNKDANFSNSGCSALLSIVSNAVINTFSGTFSNGGTIIENATGNSNISSNTGLVQNLNGGTFNIGTNTGVLTTTPGNQPTIVASPSLTITQGQSATLTASGAQTYSWSNGQSTSAISVSVAGPYSVTGTIGSCASVTTVTLTVNAPVCGAGLSGPIWTGCVSRDWNTAGNWASGTVPTTTSDVVIPSAPANQPVISTNAVAKSVEVQSGASLSITVAGSLTLNGSKSVGGSTTAFYNGGTVANSGQLVMGNTAAVGNQGIFNVATFINNAGGTISIDRSGSFGLRNNAGSFTNSGTLTIGAVASVGQYGLYNVATFSNNAGGTISIDRTTDYGLFNDGSTNTFTNSGTITIGAVASVGTDGINNQAIFSNTGCGGLIRIVSNSIVRNRGTFANGGTIIENASGNSSISTNGGLVQNKNGGTFTVTTGNQPLSVSATNPTTCTPPNGSLTLNGLQANTTYGLSYTVGGNATTVSPAPVSDANGQFTIGNLGAGIYTIALSGSCVAQTLFMSATLTGTASPTITTQPAAGSAVCVGGTVSISVNVSGTGPFTYQWYRNGSMVGGQTSAALSLTNVQITDAGSYSVVVSSSCNSATSTAFSLTVNTPPTVSITASPSLTVCRGASVTLTASAGNAGTTYQWNNGQTTQTIVINTNDPSGNPGPGGGYSGPAGPQSVTVTNAGGCSATATVYLTINPIPTASITPSNLTVCQGQPASLTASGGSTYLWNTGETTAVISVTATGVYSVTVSGETGPTGNPGARRAAAEGCSAVASSTVTVNPGPTNASLTSGTLSCAQTSVTLTASATGGTSYTLTGGAGTQSNTTGQFLVSQPGGYTVTIANASGCTAMASASVSQDNTLPSVSIAANPSLTITLGQSATLTAQGATTYHWSTNENMTAIVVTTAGPYSVTGTGTNGCSSATSVTLSVINTAPVATANASQTATVGVPFSYLVNAFTDAETPNQLTYSASINPANGFSFDPATRIISGTPSMSGVSSVTVTATDPGSLSASTTFTITVSPAFGSGALSVLHQDVSFGQTTTNTILPYLQLVNSGAAPIAYSAITVRYWLTVEGNSPITNFQNYYVQIGGNNVHEQYVPLATPRQGATAYVEYRFDAAAGNLAGGTNSGPIQNGFSKGDYSAFNQSDDYSYVANRDYTANARITAYVNGFLVYGQEPPGMGPVTPLSLMLTASPTMLTTSGTTTLSATVSGGTTPYSYSFTGPGTITPSGNTASVSNLPAGVQTYTVVVRDATSPTSQTIAGTVSVTVTQANTAPVATANASQTATVGVAFSYLVNAFTDAETPNQLTYQASIDPANGFSFDPTTRIISGTPSMSGVSSVTIKATDPGSLSASTTFTITVNPAPVAGNAQLTVLHQDVSFGQTTTNTILPYLQLVNSGAAPIAYSAITVRYWLTVEGNSPITNFQNYYVQIGGNNVHEQYVPLATPRQGATAYVEYRFDAAAGSLVGGTNSGPIQNGFSKGDYSAFNQSDDYSYVANRDYTANARITAYVNGVLVYGQEPPVGARIGATESKETLGVQVLGNPLVHEVVEVTVSGAGGQSLLYQLTDARGHLVGEQRVNQAGSLDYQRLSVVGQPAGILLLRVSTPTQHQTVKVLKGE